MIFNSHDGWVEMTEDAKFMSCGNLIDSALTDLLMQNEILLFKKKK